MLILIHYFFNVTFANYWIWKLGAGKLISERVAKNVLVPVQLKRLSHTSLKLLLRDRDDVIVNSGANSWSTHGRPPPTFWRQISIHVVILVMRCGQLVAFFITLCFPQIRKAILACFSKTMSKANLFFVHIKICNEIFSFNESW